MKKILFTLTILSWILVFFFSAALFLNREILPHFGLFFQIHHSGDSMLPTIEDGDLVLLDSTVPFSELCVGDIVVYREAIKVYHSNYVKKGEEPKADVAPFSIEYLPNRYVIHRIVAITSNGLILKGDHNESNDPYPIGEEGFVSKMVWLGKGMAVPFQWMEKRFLWLVGAAAILTAIILLARFLRN